MKSNYYFILVASGLLVACGSSEKGAEHAGHEHGEHGDGKGHDEHPKMAGAVKSFHDVLSPVYHMEKGAARVEATCKASAAMKDQAAALTTEAGGDEAAQKRAAKLTVDMTALEKGCAAEGRASVEADLEAVHESFHAVMEKK